MKVSYTKLWKLLIDKKMRKTDLTRLTGISTATMARISKDENVTTDVLVKICSVLNCDVSDILEIRKDEEPHD